MSFSKRDRIGSLHDNGCYHVRLDADASRQAKVSKINHFLAEPEEIDYCLNCKRKNAADTAMYRG